MGRITLYGVPSSIWQSIRGIFAGTIGGIFWKLLILTVVGLVAYTLVAAGGALGGFVGAILLSALWEDDIRAAVRNIWNRNWAEVEAPW